MAPVRILPARIARRPSVGLLLKGRAGMLWLVCLLAFPASVLAADGPPALFGPAEAHYERAAHFLREGDTPAALLQLDQAVQIAPDSPKVLRLYAQVLVLSDQNARAQEILRRLGESEPLGAGYEYEIALANYRMGDWAAARDRLHVMASRAPEPGSAYLYLGSAHQELGDLDAAGEAFSQALNVNPALAGAVAYRRAILAIQHRLYGDAIDQFEIVVEQLPGTPLAVSAREYIEQLEKLNPRPWEVFARVGIGYDSNINLVNSDESFVSSGEEGWRFTAAAGGSYLFGNDELWLQVGQTAYGHFYTEDGQFDQQTSLTWAQAQVQISDVLEADLRYGFEFAWADWDDYRSSQNVEPALTWELSSRVAARASFRLEDRTYYRTVSPDYDRNGSVEYAGLDLFYVFPANNSQASNWMRVGFRYRNEDTSGDQFLSSGQQPIVTLAFGLPWQLQSILDFRIEWRDYDAIYARPPSDPDFPAPGPVSRREDRIAILRAGLERPLGEHASLEMSYRFTDRDSNVDFFTYDRHEISFMGTYRY